MDRKKQQMEVLEIQMVVLCRIVSTGVWEVVSEKIEGSSLRTHLGMRTHPASLSVQKLFRNIRFLFPCLQKGDQKAKCAY